MTDLSAPDWGLASGAQVRTHVVGHRTVLAVIGEIDIATVALLEQSVDGAIDDGAAELWIDLSHTTFLDTTGVHLLVDTRRRLAALNRRLAIICPPGRIRYLLDVVNVSGALPLFADRPSAHQAA
jgi:anti-anti-sigma factor